MILIKDRRVGINMRIMLQGYLHDANFGDILSAHLFYRRCQELGVQEIDFFQNKEFGIGDFCRNELAYYVKKSVLDCIKSDVFVIIAGGSFWNNKHLVNDAKKRYLRFVLPALLYVIQRKPVYILGVGGGAVDTLWLRKKMIRVLEHSDRVLFRDEYTCEVFAGYGVKNKLEVTADVALVIKSDMLDKLEEKESLDLKANGRKKLLLHIPDSFYANSCIVERILPALIQFLKIHKEYLLVLSHDNIREKAVDEEQKIEELRSILNNEGISYYFYNYHDCWQMCSFINEMDCIVTLKLHVGVVGCALNKCVISFPVHREKTDNFYKMIGESERCVNMRNLDAEKTYKQLCKYHDKPVNISDELRNKAEMNLSVLDDIVINRR